MKIQFYQRGEQMFIVNQKGDECEQIRAVSYYLDYDALVKEKLREIYKNTSGASYHFGSTKKSFGMLNQTVTMKL